ncbi:MAG: acetate--CoA ligase family protein [Bacteroidetes bacterium]|nr:acetate--CoA ligase family protein [Bacteroidota bacterium]
MKIHEYQAKEILARYGVPVPRGSVAATPEEARKITRDLGGKAVVKAQVHAGGRGKAGGVKLVTSPDEAAQFAESIIGTRLVTFQTGPEGVPVRRVLVEEAESKASIRVTGFAEKEAAVAEAGAAWINAGVYVLAPDALGDVPQGEHVSLERVVFPQLVKEDTLWAMRFPEAPFLDIGTPDDYARAALVLG